MSPRITINRRNGDDHFYFEQLSQTAPLGDFSCFIGEYNEYLFEDALRSQKDHVALTWLLRERTSGAVSASFQERYKGIGSFLIVMASHIARACNNQFFACRFITVDADIEHNESVIDFYRKNGFVPNSELNKKHSKTISMRKDIWG